MERSGDSSDFKAGPGEKISARILSAGLHASPRFGSANSTCFASSPASLLSQPGLAPAPGSAAQTHLTKAVVQFAEMLVTQLGRKSERNWNYPWQKDRHRQAGI
jgi:hypothetical protein